MVIGYCPGEVTSPGFCKFRRGWHHARRAVFLDKRQKLSLNIREVTPIASWLRCTGELQAQPFGHGWIATMFLRYSVFKITSLSFREFILCRHYARRTMVLNEGEKLTFHVGKIIPVSLRLLSISPPRFSAFWKQRSNP